LNHGFTYSEIIGPRGEGRTVLGYLSERYPHSTEAQWKARLEAGLLRLDESATAPDDLLHRGQRLAWTRPPWEEPEVPLAFAVLYRDEDLLAVAKPSGLPTIPAGGYLEHTLLALVRRQYPETAPLHRLGRGTSGIVLFARTALARSELLQSWRTQDVHKVYRALVQGQPAQDTFMITAAIGPIAHPLLGTVHGASPSGRASLSHVRVLERRADCSLVEVEIETGRPHQIRIHMAACGHPLVGDPLYAMGGGLQAGETLPGEEGYRLHAWRLAFPHPRRGTRLEIQCQPPPILRPQR
jgi:23S rRNA pseudouridine1911/1915/1917 synthase